MLNTIIAIPFFLHDPYSTATSTTKITTVKASGSFHVIVSLSTKNRSFKFSHCSITEIELVLLTNTSDGFTIKLNFNFFLTDVYHITCMHCILIIREYVYPPHNTVYNSLLRLYEICQIG